MNKSKIWRALILGGLFGLFVSGVFLLSFFAFDLDSQIVTFINNKDIPPTEISLNVDQSTATPESILSPTWTSVPASLSAPTELPVTYIDQYQDSYEQILSAKELMVQENYAEAVKLWDEIIAVLPEYGYAYSQRSQAYYNLAIYDQRYYSETEYYLGLAYEDVNKAIELGLIVGDLYFHRHWVLKDIASLDDVRENQMYWLELALDDILKANELGNGDEFSERYPAFLLLDLERCQEALDEFSRLITLDPEAAKSAGINTGIAQSFVCFGDYDKALAHMNLAIEIYPSFPREWDRAIIEYNTGNHQAALDWLNTSIQEDPYYSGDRYYFRALINYDLGLYELAQEDIEMGSSQVWGMGGLGSYVMGLLAIRDGDTEYGHQLMEYAEASLPSHYGPAIRNRIRQDLDLPEISIETPNIPANIAAILEDTPIISAQPTLRPPVIIEDQGNMLVHDLPASYIGTGPFMLGIQQQGVTLRFVPDQLLNVVSVKSLKFYIVPQTPDEGFPLSLSVFKYQSADSIKDGLTIQVIQGVNEYELPDGYISKNGDLFIRIVNEGDEPIQILNLGVQLVFDDENGNEIVYGVDIKEE